MEEVGASGKKQRDLPKQLKDLQDNVENALNRLERTLTHADQAQVRTIEQQLQRLCNSLAPERKPQERVLSVVSYLFEHGWDMIPRLLTEMELEDFGLQEVEL